MFKSALATVTAERIALEDEVITAMFVPFYPEGVFTAAEVEQARRVVKFKSPRLEALRAQEESLTEMVALG